MDLLSECIAVLSNYWRKVGKHTIEEGIVSIKTRSTFRIALSDRPWLFGFLVFRSDLRWKGDDSINWLAELFCQGQITEQEIWAWIEEALADVPLCPLPQLPEPSDLDLWCAVRVEKKLFCCSCRSLFEGQPLFESQVAVLRDELPCTICSDCEIDL